MSKDKLLASAQRYSRKGQYKKAIQEYRKVLERHPGDVRARLNLANLYYRQGETDPAVQTFLAVASIYEDGGFTLKAIAVYKQVLKLVPDRDDLYVALAVNYQQHGLLNEAANQYREALKLLDVQGDDLGKLHVIRQILDLDPDNVPDRLRLAEAFSAHGQITDAVREFRKVAQTLEKLGYGEDYQRTAERLLYHQADDAAMARKLASSYLAAGQPQRALPKLKIAFRASPRDLEVLGCLADVFNQLGQIHKAVTVLKEMARLYDQAGLDRERDDCFSEILVLNPDDTEARKAIGSHLPTGDEGQTIEFDPAAAVPERPSEPEEPLPPAPPDLAAQDERPVDPFEATGAMPAITDEQLRPPVPPPAEAEEAERVIEEMIRDAIGDSAPELPPPRTSRTPSAAARDLEALYSAALGEEGAEPPSQDAVAPAEHLENFEFELEDDFDEGLDDELRDLDGDEVGFGRGELADVTIADQAFIPRDVLASVQGGLDLVIPGGGPAAREPSAPGVEADAGSEEPPETFGPGEELFAEELQELDFYMTNGLHGEAALLLSELEERYPDHPYLKRRRASLDSA